MAPPSRLRSPQRTRRARRRGSAHARRHPRSLRTIWALTALAVFLLAAGAVGAQAWIAKGELQVAQSLVSDLKAQVVAGKYTGAADKFGEIRQHTAKARGLTGGPLWSVAEHVPFLGSNLAAMRGLTQVIDATTLAAEPLVGLAKDLSPATLAPHNGALPLAPFVQAVPVVTTAAADFDTLRAQIAAVPTAGTVHQLQAAKTTLADVIGSTSTALNQAVPIVRTLPALLGARAPRTYVVMFLNNAELRSLGGTALSFAEITVDHGAIKLARVVPAGDRNFAAHPESVIPVPGGFDSIYPGALGRFIANATLRPSAMTATEIVQAEWKTTFGKDVNGVISMDSGALSLLLKAVGPVTISTGDVVSSTNVQSLLLNEVYARYNSGDIEADSRAYKLVYAETVSATFDRLSSGKFDPVVLFDSLRTAAAARNLDVLLTDPAEQAAIASTPFAARDLPESTATKDVVGMYLNNQSASKLDYYLGTTLTTGSAVCTPDGRQVHRAGLALTNTLAPAAVAGVGDPISGTWYKSLGLAKGEQRYVVFVYLPKGATLLAASVDGKPIAPTHQVDNGHPVQNLWINVLPGATATLSVDVLMGAQGNQTLQTDVTPTVQGTKTLTAPLDCASVKLP